MAKLIELKEAAEKLGISPEALTELVDQKKIFGYRDGASWKFKPSELDRVASELDLGGLAAEAAHSKAEDIGSGLGLVGGDDDMIDVGELQLDDSDDDGGSILISEEELGRSDDGTSSTIIGQVNGNAEDSDIQIAAEQGEEVSLDASTSDLAIAGDSDLAIDGGSDLQLAVDDGSDLQIATDGGSELMLDEGGSKPSLAGDEGGGVTLAGDSDLSVADSDIGLAAAGASDVLAGDSDLLNLDEGTGLGLSNESESGIDLSLVDDSGIKTDESSLALASDDELSLDDDELSLDSASGIGSSPGMDSAIELDLDEDDLLAGSGMGSDITLGASDSGINLSNPSDSGISLEDVGSDLGSGIDSSLELSDEVLELDESADPDDATELQTEDEFMLTPVEGDDDLIDESDDSGSQVIALGSDEFDESAATMLVPDDDPFSADEGDLMDDVGGAIAGAAAVGAGAAAAVAAADEAEFSVWNIVSLCMLAFFMLVCGFLAMDVLRNIWSWQQPFGISGSLMDLLVGS